MSSDKPVHRLRVLPGKRLNKRCYGVTKELCSAVYASGQKYFYPPYAKDILEKPKGSWRSDAFSNDRATWMVLVQLFELRQVVAVKIRRFELVITIGSAFDWEDIEKRILTILRDNLFDPSVRKDVELQDWVSNPPNRC